LIIGAVAQILAKNPNFSPSQVAETLLGKATQAMIALLEPTSPNLLLFTRGASMINTVNIVLVISCLLLASLV